MASTLVLRGSAVVPSLLLLWYIYARDRNPEPRGLLLKTFLLGAAICAPVVPVAIWLESLGRHPHGSGPKPPSSATAEKRPLSVRPAL